MLGTHTHVPTADERVLPGGTAYMSDVGMTGPRGGVIGVKKEQAIKSLVDQMCVRFETSEDDPWLMGVAHPLCGEPAAGGVDRAGAATVATVTASSTSSTPLRSGDDGDDRRVLGDQVEVARRELELASAPHAAGAQQRDRPVAPRPRGRARTAAARP